MMHDTAFQGANQVFYGLRRTLKQQLKTYSFVKKSDSNGRTFITLGFNELEKNHQGFHKRDYQEDLRMYEQG